MGLPVMEAPSNDPRARVEAIKAPMGRLIEGKPGIIIHPRCKNLIKALQGAWCFKRLAVSGEKFRDVPDKNEYSHVADALGYLLLGAGEGNAMRGRAQTKHTGSYVAKTKFKVLD
jgi:hypothetical protein